MNNNNLEALRHSASHVLAEAVMRLYPGTKLGVGPAIEDGFYYDFELPERISEEDLEKISSEMKKIVKEKQQFLRKSVSRAEAESFFNTQPYKLELLEAIPEEEDISIYENGDFADLCRGPHVNNSCKVKHFKLLKTAGAYWRGDEANKMLTRIYGTVFPLKVELDEYLENLRLAKERDHRKLGKEMDLFSIHPQEAGPGLVYWHPKGAAIRREIEDFWLNEHRKSGYELLNIPHVAKSGLWDVSGHTDFYSDYMYPKMELKDGESYILKPMNCPGHIIIYKNTIRSYREFPLRWAELGTVYRYEKPGVLHGLMRVRGFTQDDAHIFCRPEQIDEEISGVLSFVLKILRTFSFNEFKVYLSTRPEKYVGDDYEWELAEAALKKALEKSGLDYEIDPGEGVFYGPKIDIKIKDSLNRLWQCSTVQADFNIPRKFELEYINEKGERERPVMIHRALFGSLERFFGILIEHYGGRFPLWLAPEKAEIIPVGESHIEYARRVADSLLSDGIKVSLDNSSDKLGKKIWRARSMNIPYMAIIGDREIEENKISVRSLTGGEEGKMSAEEFRDFLRVKISEKE